MVTIHECPGRDNLNPAKRVENEKIGISADDRVCPSAHGQFETSVVRRVTAISDDVPDVNDLGNLYPRRKKLQSQFFNDDADELRSPENLFNFRDGGR